VSVRFAQTLGRTQQAVRSQPWHSRLEAVTVIRDVKGQIHLFLEGYRPEEQQRQQLHAALSDGDALGPYWTGDLWLPDPPALAMAEMIRDQRSVLPGEAGDPRWYVLERHIAKQSWTGGAGVTEGPWPLEEVYAGRAPAVAAFLSFKGGVGRTTTVASVALVLTRCGHRVALLDLDLEAPGLASMFLPPGDDRPGVVDYLIEKPVQGEAWRVREGLYSVTDPIAISEGGAPLRLLPAGNVDQDYLEKLSRVDVQNLSEGHLARTLRQLLRELRSEIAELDFILIDARAGLHELGGLALSELAHVAVLFGIQSAQSWAGLRLLIRRLAKPDQEQGMPVILVHALAPLLEQAGGETERRKFSETAYDLFSDLYYRQGEVPGLSDPDQPHVPLAIPWLPELRGEVSLSVDTHGSERVRSSVERLTSGSYFELAQRLCLLMGRNLRPGAASSPR